MLLLKYVALEMMINCHDRDFCWMLCLFEHQKKFQLVSVGKAKWQTIHSTCSHCAVKLYDVKVITFIKIFVYPFAIFNYHNKFVSAFGVHVFNIRHRCENRSALFLLFTSVLLLIATVIVFRLAKVSILIFSCSLLLFGIKIKTKTRRRYELTV